MCAKAMLNSATLSRLGRGKRARAYGERTPPAAVSASSGVPRQEGGKA
jgi:hypothetical protein